MFTSRKHSKIVSYRVVWDAKSGTFYIYSHTSFPSIHQLLAYYRDTPINPDINTRLLVPIPSKQQQKLKQQLQQITLQQSVQGKWAGSSKDNEWEGSFTWKSYENCGIKISIGCGASLIRSSTLYLLYGIFLGNRCYNLVIANILVHTADDHTRCRFLCS